MKRLIATPHGALELLPGLAGRDLSRDLVSRETYAASLRAVQLHQAIADNGFTNRAVVYYQMSMAGYVVPGGLAG